MKTPSPEWLSVTGSHLHTQPQLRNYKHIRFRLAAPLVQHFPASSLLTPPPPVADFGFFFFLVLHGNILFLNTETYGPFADFIDITPGDGWLWLAVFKLRPEGGGGVGL